MRLQLGDLCVEEIMFAKLVDCWKDYYFNAKVAKFKTALMNYE
jgi:hypothetical protein